MTMTHLILVALGLVGLVVIFTLLFRGHRSPWMATPVLILAAGILTTPPEMAALPYAGASLMPWNLSEEHSHWNQDGITTRFLVRDDGLHGIMLHRLPNSLRTNVVPVRISRTKAGLILTPLDLPAGHTHYLVTQAGDLEIREKGSVYRVSKG